MVFDAPVSFREAVKTLLDKKIFPTSMKSAELQTIDAAIRRQSFFSAQTTLSDYLDRAKSVVESIVNPKQVIREALEAGGAQTVTEGFNPATARTELKGLLDQLEYRPEEGTKGTITDLSSDKRVDLVVKTNVELAHGAGRFIQENKDPDVVDLWPALEFTRFEERQEPRDWEHRWMIAAQVAGDSDAARVLDGSGRMVALKSSDIWQQLGDGAGGYMDTLGNPYPPFAFNSGMWTEEIDRDEAIELGLIEEGEAAAPARFDLASLFSLVTD